MGYYVSVVEKPGEIRGFRDFSLLGSGGMGQVYSATNERLGRREAVKVLREVEGEYVARFEREARVAASVSKHPNLVTIYGAGVDDGRPWLSMELIDGANLRQLMARGKGRLEPDEALFAVLAVARGLDHLHAHGVVHRDVKPENILVPAAGGCDAAALTDFGIARAVDGADRLTRTGMVPGTAPYLAPEQFSAGPVDGRVDQYSLACVLVEALTGMPAAEGDDFTSLVGWHLHGERPSVSRRNRLLPQALDAVIIRALDPDPAARWESCSAFADAAVAAFLGDGGSATATSGGAAPVASGGAATAASGGASGADGARRGGHEAEAASRNPSRPNRRRAVRAMVIGSAVIAAVAVIGWMVAPSSNDGDWEGLHADLVADYPEFLPKTRSSGSDAGHCVDGPQGFSCAGGEFSVRVTRYPDRESRVAELARFEPVAFDVPADEECVRNHPIDVYPVVGGFLLAPEASGLDRDVISVGVGPDDVGDFWDWWERVEITGC